MASVIIRIEGEQQVVKEIGMFEMEKKKRAMAVVKKYATAVRKEARNRVPVSPSNRIKKYGSPGDLKRSIQAKYYYEGLGAMILPATPKGWHRGIVETGTKERTKGHFRGKGPAQPFMEPAKRAQEAGYNSEMGAIFEDGDTEI